MKLVVASVVLISCAFAVAQRGHSQPSQTTKAYATIDRLDRLDRIKANRDRANLIKPAPLTLRAPANKKAPSDSKKS